LASFLMDRMRHRREIGIAILPVVAVWAVFGQTLSFPFVNYDDPVYVTENWLLQSDIGIDSMLEAMTLAGKSGHWHPLTWISLMLDHQLFGLEPWGYHLTNVVLHSANSVLLFVLLRWATGSHAERFGCSFFRHAPGSRRIRGLGHGA
jgi:hypothetical protein